MGKFDSLLMTEDWAKALEILLEQAAVASKTGGGAQKVQSDLFAFIKASPGKCDFLDDIAAKAASDLFETEVDRLIKSIASRKAELQIATKALKGITKDLEKSESKLRFEKIIETLEVSANLINELKKFSDEFDEGDHSLFERAFAIGKLIEALQNEIKRSAG